MLKRIFALSLFLITFIAYANPLLANKAFNLSVKQIDPNTMQLKWRIAKNYFLYKDRLQITNFDDKLLNLGEIIYPKPQEKIDPKGKIIPIYKNKLILNIPTLSLVPGEAYITIVYQGCSDEGFCYPPEKVLIQLTTNTNLEITKAYVEDTSATVTKPAPAQITSNSRANAPTDFDKLFTNNNFVVILLSFFGFGLLLSFTPCILPMVPVISSIIVGHGHKISTSKAFFLSLSYVLSMSITYGLIGAGIALLGNNLQALMQSPIVISLFSLVFVILALSMFDVYELKLPLSLQNKLATITRSQSGGHYLSAAILGSMSILVLSPCVTAPLIGALSYIAQTGDVLLGLSTLFFLSFGMGVPLLLIGTSAGKLLPKAGLWMNTVKDLFGIILIAVAIYLISRILPSFLTMILWACLCVFTGVYLNPTDITFKQNKFKRGLSLLVISYGLLILFGASLGNSNPILPLKSSKIIFNDTSKTIVVDNLDDTKKALEIAKNNQTPVMLYFYADWCASCQTISSTKLQDFDIMTELNRVQLIKVDITKNDKTTKDLLQYFNVIAPPTFIFFNKLGKIEKSLQLVGDISIANLLQQLRKI
jgi:thiol:disulfide interchange protein DsbD